MRQFQRLLTTTMLAVALGLGVIATPADAAPPPTWYPSASVISVTQNTRLGIGIPLRQGFYDADQDAGFGWDKIGNKHNIWDSNAVKVLAASPSATPVGSRYNLATWAGKLTCNPLCRVTAQVELTLGVAPYYQNNYTYYSRLTGRTVVVPIATNGSIYGVVTGFCKGYVRCPNWVTYSLTNPGKVNPYRVGNGAEPSLPAASGQPIAKNEVATEQGEARTLEQEQLAGGEAYVYSYEPLPMTVDAEDAERAISSGRPLSEVINR